MFDCYDTLITPEEVADMLGCGMNTTYKLLKSGKIKAMRIGRSWKIPKRAADISEANEQYLILITHNQQIIITKNQLTGILQLIRSTIVQRYD